MQHCTVPSEFQKFTREAFINHCYSKQLWSTPHLYLNAVQEEAAQLAFTNPFQLIQGPPGYCYSYTFFCTPQHCQ